MAIAVLGVSVVQERNVKPSTRQRWVGDRKRLREVLREYEAGTTPDLSKTERETVIASLRTRIRDLNEKLAGPLLPDPPND